VDQVVELERIDSTGVQTCEALAYVLQQMTERLLVVGADRLSRRAPPRTLAETIAAWSIIGHDQRGIAAALGPGIVTAPDDGELRTISPGVLSIRSLVLRGEGMC
jgi:hypothetical protein